MSQAVDGAEPMQEPLRSTYEGAALACLAALHGRADLWELAEKRHDRVTPSALDCWDRSVYTILHELVDVHRENPDAIFALATGTASACPELEPFVFPGHGPLAGGYTVEIRGRNLPMELELLWNFDRTVTATRKDTDSPMLLVVPAARPDDKDVLIKISGAPRIEAIYTGFTYDDK
ncbi:hypothetical protein ACQPZX_25140 [Actinoplanes sp. CA-142083]|uniref:hypothetical protein n=1 Tax=Actinoplanes sp. CA-142083 TaxID=3239903 RepID=UPI003D8BD6D0